MTNLWFHIQDFIDRVKKVFLWIPVIWNDWDSEGGHLWNLMMFKLRRVRIFFMFEVKNISDEERSQIVTALENAIRILYRLANNIYETELLGEIIIKWGTPVKTEKGYEFSEVKTEADKKQYYRDEDRLTKKMIKDRKMDIKKLMDILENDLPMWSI